MTTLRRYDAGTVTLPVPEDWLHGEQDMGAAVAVAEGYRPGSFAANLVVSVHELLAGESERDWVGRVVAELAAGIPRLRVLDTEDLELGGRPAARVLSHYPLPEFGGVTVEQWLVTDAERPVVLSCSVATLEYDDRADVFAEIAAGLRIAAERGPDTGRNPR